MNRFFSATGVPPGIDSSWLDQLGSIIKKRFDVAREIVIAFVDDNRMKELNNRYRRKNAITDVLSFSYEEDDSEALGEIIISKSKVRSQARDKKHTQTKEFQTLTIHGVLHILGYDHEYDTDAEVMEALEQEIMDELENTLAS